MPTIRTGPASIAQYGPGWAGSQTCVWRARSARIVAISSSVGREVCRQSLWASHPRTPGPTFSGARSASIPQMFDMKPCSPSYQSWFPGTA